MDKNKLLKISLTFSFIGVFSLLLISQILKPVKVKSYQDLTLNKKVFTTSVIKEIKTYNDFSIINLKNNITITCNKCNLNKSQKIKVQGRVTNYKGIVQIQSEKIKIV